MTLLIYEEPASEKSDSNEKLIPKIKVVRDQRKGDHLRE